jgi:adenosylhomocysteinase
MSDIADASLAESGQRRIAWAERAMPVLRQIRQRYADTRPLDGVRIGACLHVTAETANLARTLAAGGAEVALCASNPLSTQDDTAAALAADGIAVFARALADPSTYDAHIDAVLDLRPSILLDDGCDLTDAVHGRRSDVLSGISAGCEDTTTGIVRLRAMSRAGLLRFPVVDLNDTDTKRMFDARFGTGQSTIDAILRATNILLAGKIVVVAGFGAAGRGVAERARGMGADVVVTEVDPLRALDARLHGYRVLAMSEAAAIGDLFITVTGNRDVVRREHFEAMKDGAIVANAGHFDVEVDVVALTQLATDCHAAIRPHTDEYVLADGRRILVLAEGRVVNLAAAEGHPATIMDLAFATEVLTVEWLVTGAAGVEAGVHAVPIGIDRDVAALELAAAGIRLDQLSAEQRGYLTAWATARLGSRATPSSQNDDPAPGPPAG